MAQDKLTDRTELVETPAADDLFYVVDVSDPNDDATGSSKKIQFFRLTGGIVRFSLTGAWGTLLADVDKSTSGTPTVLEAGDRFSGWIASNRYVVGVVISLPFDLDDEASVKLAIDNEI